MSELKEQIFNELSELQEIAKKLRLVADDATTLSCQLAQQKEKNKKAQKYINAAIEKLKVEL
jgi:hypothetical protein